MSLFRDNTVQLRIPLANTRATTSETEAGNTICFRQASFLLPGLTNLIEAVPFSFLPSHILGTLCFSSATHIATIILNSYTQLGPAPAFLLENICLSLACSRPPINCLSTPSNWTLKFMKHIICVNIAFRFAYNIHHIANRCLCRLAVC